MATTSFVRLIFTYDFDARAADEASSRGYLSYVSAELSDGSLHALTFYDPLRLSQTINDVMDGAKYFAEPGLIIVADVTIENMELAARELAASGFFNKGPM